MPVSSVCFHFKVAPHYTRVCAWSPEEAARYIETFKAYENKAPDVGTCARRMCLASLFFVLPVVQGPTATMGDLRKSSSVGVPRDFDAYRVEPSPRLCIK